VLGTQPGSYAGGGLSFFVSRDGAHVQDITMNVTLTCTPSSGSPVSSIER
jgi:hypothetical protein